MRLRRLELAVLGVTLAFAVFMGGYFTGRSLSAVNITSVETGRTQLHVEQQQTQANSNNTGQENTTANGQVTVNPDSPNTQATSESNDITQPAGDGRININTASQAQLMDLPGIGNTLASRIIEYRTQNGSFARIEDLRNVSGIGERRFEAIQDFITVGN